MLPEKKNELEIGVSWGTDVENGLFWGKLVLVDLEQQLGYGKLHEKVTDRELVSALDMYQRYQREREYLSLFHPSKPGLPGLWCFWVANRAQVPGQLLGGTAARNGNKIKDTHEEQEKRK